MIKWVARRINDTSRPWAVIEEHELGEPDVIICGSTTEVHAKLIVDAVNMHGDLVAALRHALTLAEDIMLERD